MILTDSELRLYRGIVGTQLHFAERGDAHKVAEMQMKLIGLIQKICTRYLFQVTGDVWVVEMPNSAAAEYALMVGRAMEASALGFKEWAEHQVKIEAWVSGYIESAAVQAQPPTIAGISENKN